MTQLSTMNTVICSEGDRSKEEEVEETTLITDVYCKSIMSSVLNRDKETSLSDYEKLQLEYQAALKALHQLAEGVRIVTRQMKHQHNDDNDSVVSASSDTTPLRGRTFSNGTVSTCSVVSEDDRRIDDITQSLDGVMGSDLLGLAQAAQMVNEHARLATQEASMLTDDMVLAAKTAQQSLERAVKAEQAAIRFHKEKTTLQFRVEQLLVERKVLAKEIKSLRKENASLKKFKEESKRQEMAFALEQHVKGALMIHEQHLAAASRNHRAESWDYADEGATWKPIDFGNPPNPAETNPGTPVEPPASLEVSNTVVDTTKPKHVITRSVGFGGAGLAGLGYKFNRAKSSLKTSRASKECMETPVETPATVAVEANATKVTLSTSDDNSNKENASNETGLTNVGRNIMGEISSASSTFANFFVSRPMKEPPAPVPNSRLNPLLESPNAMGASMSKAMDSPLPPMVIVNEPCIPSPYADDSPLSTKYTNYCVDTIMECDEKMLRSLSLPEDESQLVEHGEGVANNPNPHSIGLYEA